MLLGVQGLNGARRAAASFLARYGDPTPQKSDKEPVLAAGPASLILARPTPTRACRACARSGPTPTPARGLLPISYEVIVARKRGAVMSGMPMIMRILSISRASNLETCIWLVPISTAISDCERCS